MLGHADGLRTESVVNLDDIDTIPLASLDRRITELSAEKMFAVEEAIRYALALPPFQR